MHARFQAPVQRYTIRFAQIVRQADGDQQTVRATQPPHGNHPRYRVVTRRAESARHDEDPAAGRRALEGVVKCQAGLTDAVASAFEPGAR
jgi:hypothetical protein